MGCMRIKYSTVDTILTYMIGLFPSPYYIHSFNFGEILGLSPVSPATATMVDESPNKKRKMEEEEVMDVDAIPSSGSTLPWVEKYRPSSLEQVEGQAGIVGTLKKLVE